MKRTGTVQAATFGSELNQERIGNLIRVEDLLVA